MKVKICGITRWEDAQAAIDAGADALGFNFWPRSKRYIPPSLAKRLVERLPAEITAVGVFVNAPMPALKRAVAASGVGVVQLHGDESRAFCAGVSWPVIKASAKVLDWPVAAVLLDTPSEGYGGSGRTSRWRRLPEGRFMLAGGLTPENVSRAIGIARPWGVDVASGVERAPGIKDRAKMARFIAEAKRA